MSCYIDKYTQEIENEDREISTEIRFMLDNPVCRDENMYREYLERRLAATRKNLKMRNINSAYSNQRLDVAINKFKKYLNEEQLASLELDVIKPYTKEELNAEDEDCELYDEHIRNDLAQLHFNELHPLIEKGRLTKAEAFDMVQKRKEELRLHLEALELVEQSLL